MQQGFTCFHNNNDNEAEKKALCTSLSDLEKLWENLIARESLRFQLFQPVNGTSFIPFRLVNTFALRFETVIIEFEATSSIPVFDPRLISPAFISKYKTWFSIFDFAFAV